MKSEELGLPIEYQQYPEFFDIPSNSENTNKKNAVIEKLLKKHGAKTILDMTCGTGAQVFYLSERGYKVIGSDFSPGLIKIAKEKASHNNLMVQFFDGDMRTVQLGEFDAVITIDNAIGHLVKSDFHLALKNIARNLKTGGLYIFDILNLDAMTDEVINLDSEKVSDSTTTTDGTILSNIRTTNIDRINGILTSNEILKISKNGHEKQVKNCCSLQIYTMIELENILSLNGFETLEQHKIDTYTFQSDNSGYGILTVARKIL